MLHHACSRLDYHLVKGCVSRNNLVTTHESMMSGLSLFCGALIVLLGKEVSSSDVYVKENLPVLPCKENTAKDVCPTITHKIPDFSGIHEGAAANLGNTTFIEATLAPIMKIEGLSDACKAAFRGYICTALLPTCDENSAYIEVFGSKMKQACENALAKCPDVLKEHINCENSQFGNPRKFPRHTVCTAFPKLPEDPYKCDHINYKVPEIATHENQTIDLIGAHKLLEKEASKLNKSCVTNIANTICYIGAPACSKDKKYLLDLISKEDCLETIKCLEGKNVSASFVGNATEACDALSSNTAKKFKADDVVDYSIGPTKRPTDGAYRKTAGMFFLFIFTLFATMFA